MYQWKSYPSTRANKQGDGRLNRFDDTSPVYYQFSNVVNRVDEDTVTEQTKTLFAIVRSLRIEEAAKNP